MHTGSKDSKNFANAYLDNLGGSDSNEINNKMLHVSALPEDVEVGGNTSPFNNAINKYINSKGSKLPNLFKILSLIAFRKYVRDPD